MEQWEALIRSYPASPTQGDLRKAVKSAGVVLKEDLAPFEIEWILQKLLTEPVNLLSSLSDHATDNNWASVIGAALDLLANVFMNHAEHLGRYEEDIVMTCLENYSAINRRRALNVLTGGCGRGQGQQWGGVLSAAARALTGDDAVVVRAARARLVGAICEHHPDILTQGQEITLWRTFLSVLESSKVTDSLINGALQGLCGLFKNFGMDLPIVEINGIFYEKFSRQYIQIGSCEEVCLKILSDYSHLFPEKLSSDTSLRAYLWSLLQNGSKAGDTLVAVYKVSVNDRNVQNIVTTEIYPRVYSKNPQERSVSCRILSTILKKYAETTKEIFTEFGKNASKTCTNLDFSLSMKVETLTENSEYDHDLMNLLEEAVWCIEANIPGCDSLLRSVFLLHSAIPKNRRKKLLIHTLLNAEPALRTAAITFLLSESRRNIDTYISIWREIFDTTNTDSIVEKNRQFVVEDVVIYLVKVVEVSLNEVPDEKSSEKLSELLKLCSYLFPMEHFSCHLPKVTPILGSILDLQPISEGQVLFVGALMYTMNDHHEDYDDDSGKKIMNFMERASTSENQAIRCAACIASLQIPFGLNDDILYGALKVILSRSDVDNEILIKVISKVEEVVAMDNDPFPDSEEIKHDLINAVEKLKSSKVFSGKSGRILEREIVLFLGKYGNRFDRKSVSDNSSTILKKPLTLDIPNLCDGTTLKLNISRVYELAINTENPEVLNALLSIISAYLSNKTDPQLQRALTAVIVKLSNCHSRMEGGSIDSLLLAVTLCDMEACVGEMFECISKEESPGPRKVLSNLLSHLLTLDPHSGPTVTSTRQLYDNTVALLRRPNDRDSLLECTECLLECIKQNNELFKELTPELLSVVFETALIDGGVARITIDAVVDKILIFDQKTLKEIIVNVQVFFDTNVATNISIQYVKSIVLLMKEVNKILGIADSMEMAKSSKVLIPLLVAAKDILEFDLEKCRSAIANVDQVVLQSKMEECNWDQLSDFIEHYGVILLELRYQETLEIIALRIKNLNAKEVKYEYRYIKNCVDKIKQINGQIPLVLVKQFESLVHRMNIEELTRGLRIDDLTSAHEIQINALLKILRLLNKENSKLVNGNEWMGILIKFHDDEAAILKNKMAAMTDVISVALHCSELIDIVDVCQKNLPFVKYFIGPFSPYLMGIFERLDTKTVATLYNDILNYYAREKCTQNDLSNIIQCFNQNWPRLETTQSFEELHTILLNMTKVNDLSICQDCQAVNWWVREMTVSEGDRKIQLLQVLPLFLQGGSEEYREMFNAPLNTLSEVLPLRAAWGAPAALLAAVAALAASAHRTLATQALLRLADDNVPPWLEATLEQCMCSLALKQDGELLELILGICNDDELSVCLFERAMGPMIRYSSQEICQDFFSKILPKTLASLRRPTRPSASVTYSIYLVRCARAFTLVRWCFEKMSLQALESPSSSLYSNIELNRSKNLAQEMCKLCVTLRNDVTSGGDEQMMKCFRYFQTSNYNCLAAVLLKTKPQAKFFQHLLKAETWPKLVDGDKKYVVYIEGLGRDKVRRHYVTSDSLSSGVSHTASTAPAFTRRTLSDNPFMYDLIEEYDVQTETKAILLSDNELNSHPCSTTLCTVIKHLVSIQSVSKTDLVSTKETVSMQPDWLKLIVDGLKSGSGNVGWFLAQAIINCKEDLKAYTSALTPALLAVVADSPYKHEAKNLLNGLHINILNTIHYWNGENSIDNDTAVNNITKLLISTCVHHKQRNSVWKAVMQCLGTFVQMYGKYIKIDWSFVEEILKDQTNAIVCYNILETMTVNKLYIPELLPTLITKLQAEINKQTHIAKLLGLALSSCQDVAVKMTVLSKLYRHLDRLRASNSLDYVKALFYVQNGCKDVCNEINFRHITDLTPKMVREQKTKCLKIIANYLSKCSEPTEYITAMFETIDICDSIISDETHEAMKVAECGLALMSDSLKKRVVHLICSYCDSSTVETRKAAFGVVLKAAEEFQTETGEMPAKRQRTETTSKLLQLLNQEDIYKVTVLAKIGFGLNDRNAEIRNMVFDRISNLLEARDMGVRFLESVLICIYLPSTIVSKTSNTDAPGCLTAVLKLFLHGYTSLEGFGRLRLRDEPINFRTNQSQIGPSKLLTMTRTFQGTFRSNLTLGASRRKTIKKSDESPSLDVQRPIIDLTKTLLEFAQTNTEASTSLFLEIIKHLQKDSDINGCLATQLCGVLAKNADVNEMTPCVMQACRLCVDECSRVPGFKSVLERLLKKTKRTEGYELTKLLYEDVILRTDENIFLLGKWELQEFDVDMAEKNKDFDMQEMLLCLDKLSNWDELTMQKRREIQSAGLPVLWTDQHTFRQALDAASDLPDWLSRMRSSLQQADFSSGEQYMELKNLDTWPRNPYVISCLAEIEHWQLPFESYRRLPCEIEPGDCLAEWAARLMYRLCKANDMESQGIDNCSIQARSQQLEWCSAARSRGLRRLVRPCAAASIPHLTESEIRPWLYEQCLMLRSQGLETNDQGLLKKALDKLETIAPNFDCEFKDTIREYELKWKLHRDLNSHSIQKVNTYSMQMFEEGIPVFGKNQKYVISTLELFADYLNEEWECDAGNKNDILSSIASCLSNLHMYTFGRADMMVCSLLTMLGNYEGILPEQLAQEILETLTYENHDELTLEQISLINSKFPTTLQPKILTLVERDLNIQKWKKCLELVCDVNHTLMQYCEVLIHAANQKDESIWNSTFKNMKSWLYENEFGGAEYHLLAKYKSDLYGIETFEPTDDFKTNTKAILGKIYQELRKLPPKTLINMADVCVPLSRPMSEGDGKCIAKILMLENACVVRLDRQVQVFTNSLRRPCIVVATLSSGHTKRFLIKRGEPLRADAAAARCVAALNQRSPYKCRQYMVVPLSEDCGIVEYLEDHVTIRSLLEDHNLNDISTSVRRAPDTELIVASRAASLAQFNDMCDKIPAYALRSSMENGTSCVKDFIMMKRNFQDTLASMAVYHWLLGLGDRHLENLMVSTQNGGVCGVDLAAILAFGANGPELPPARLTRLLTAVCDRQVLESRMQAVWKSLRDSYRFIWPVLKFSSKWLPGYDTEEFEKKMAYIQDLLQGRALSYEITKRMLIDSNVKYKENYCALLDEVFSDYPKKEIYEVDEQISSVLLQSTDPRILSVTRRGWEPWL